MATHRYCRMLLRICVILPFFVQCVGFSNLACRFPKASVVGHYRPASMHASASVTVDELLELVNTGGKRPRDKTPEQRERIKELFVDMESAGSKTKYLDSDDFVGDGTGGRKLWDNYELAYFDRSVDGDDRSYRNATRPFGIRSKILGKMFSLRYSFQHAVPPNTLVNFVGFSFLGLPASVTSEGIYSRCTAEEVKTVKDDSGTELRGDTAVRIDFGPPLLAAGPAWCRFVGKLGGKAQSPPVTLCLTYLDERVRLALASKGGRLLFTRGGKASEPYADEWKDIVELADKPLSLKSVAVAGAVVTATSVLIPAIRGPIKFTLAAAVALASVRKVKAWIGNTNEDSE